MHTLKILKRAENELYDSCDWYEQRKKGLARRFLKELDIHFRLITKNPALYQKQGDDNLRFSPLKKFPFVIVYWYDENLITIFVVSIFHTSREPIV